MTIRGWMMTVLVVTGALAIVMTLVSIRINRASDENSKSFALEFKLDYLIAWAAVVIPILLLLEFWKSPADP